VPVDPAGGHRGLEPLTRPADPPGVGGPLSHPGPTSKDDGSIPIVSQTAITCKLKTKKVFAAGADLGLG
jgi:hypothetical protein